VRVDKMERIQKRLGDILISRGVINQKKLDEALEIQKKSREFLGAILLKRRCVNERQLLEALAEQFSIPLVNLKDRYLNWELLKQFSPSLIMEYKCFPVEKDDFSITIAITNPMDIWAMKKSEEEAAPFKLKLVLTSHEDMEDAIERYRKYMRGDIGRILE
jgi:type IV pilus assembly protein PilB